MFKLQKIFIIPFLIIFCGIVAFFYFDSNVSNSAEPAPKQLMGYAWSSNIGWISFSCKNILDAAVCDHTKDVNNPNGYGVSVDENGLLSGYAWSENVGWISFNQADVDKCSIPSADGTCEPKIIGFKDSFEAVKPLVGWAKVLSDNSWIHLSSTSTDQAGKVFSYGARLHSSGSISGYAYSESFGWISFGGENYHVSIEGINYLFPITLSGLGFKQGAIVSLINKKSLLETPCLDEENNNDFKIGKDSVTGKDTLKGHCPLSKVEYGEYDVAVQNPTGEKSKLSSSEVKTIFKVVPPTSADLIIKTSVPEGSSVGNQGSISVTKISSFNSLIGANVGLMKGGQTKFCFTINGQNNNYDWITGMDENGNVLPASMDCKLDGIEGGVWNFVVYKIENGVEKWRESTNTSINVSCIPTGWDKPEYDVDEAKLYGTVILTDKTCKYNTKSIIGTCVPIWEPQNSCIQNFTQIADNCINKPTRHSRDAGITGTATCDKMPNYRVAGIVANWICQTVPDLEKYGTCIANQVTCDNTWLKTNICDYNDWECGDVVDSCGILHANVCGKCDGTKSCNSHKCK